MNNHKPDWENLICSCGYNKGWELETQTIWTRYEVKCSLIEHMKRVEKINA